MYLIHKAKKVKKLKIVKLKGETMVWPFDFTIFNFLTFLALCMRGNKFLSKSNDYPVLFLLFCWLNFPLRA